MKLFSKRLLNCVIILMTGIIMSGSGCKKSPDSPDPGGGPGTGSVTPAFDINSINDTYASLAPVANYLQWGPYNVHDPSIIKSGEYFYSFSTDVAYGAPVKPGIQIRKSKDRPDLPIKFLYSWEKIGKIKRLLSFFPD